MLRLQMKTEEALAGGWRRANEEEGKALPHNEVRLGRGSGGANRDQDNGGHCGSGGHCRVHHDAQLAMIGIGLAGVEVGDLSHRKQGQQDQTQYCHRRQKARPCAASSAEKCPESCQSTVPSAPILQKVYRKGLSISTLPDW
jgi:hypothetical protein